jgi:DNA-directed RNA polymerase subunit omega
VHEEFKEETIVNKVGGRFKLSTLIQKRLVALNKGARPLVELRGNDKMAIVIQEIMQDKIFLDTSNQVRTVESLNAELKGSRLLDDVDLSDD